MIEKIQWNYPWRFRHEISKNYYGRELSHYVFAELTGEKKFEIVLPKETYYLNVNGDFYGLAERSKIIDISVIPNQKLEFKVKSCWNEEYTENVKIEKINDDTYSILICSYAQEKDSKKAFKTRVDEILTKEELEEKMQTLQPTIEVYPFIHPIGKCFSLE